MEHEGYKGLLFGKSDAPSKLVLDSIGDAVCVLDAEGFTTFANQASARLTGYKPDELVRVWNHDALWHSMPDGTGYSFEECLICGAFREGAADYSSDAVFCYKNGALHRVGYSSDPIVEDGAAVGAVLIFRDVSSPSRPSEVSDQRLETLLEESRESLVLTEDGKVFEANRSFLETFGYRYEEIFGMDAGEFVVPEDRQIVGRQVSTSRMETYEARGLRKDGTSFLMQAQPRNFPYGDREVRITGVLDLTEQKESERVLRRQRDLYEGLLAAQGELGEGFVVIEDQNITYANNAFCEISGYSLEEIENMSSFLELISEKDHLDLLERRQRRAETGEGDTHYETGLRHKDGRRVDVEVAFKVFEEEPPGVTVIARDITPQIQAEQSLRKQEKRLIQLIEQAADALYVHDLEGNIVDVNSQACANLGYRRDELMSMSATDIEKNLDPRGFEGLWNEVFSGGPATIEGTHSRKDGSTFPTEIRMGLFESDEGYLMLAAARYVTKRKAVERELQISERSLVEAQRIASFGNWEYDLQEDEARCSDQLYRIFGHEPGAFEPTYRTFLEAVHPDDRDAVRQDSQTALEDGNGSGLDFRVVKPDGEVRVVHALYEVIRNSSDRPSKMVGTVHDVTERRRTEEALRQSEERFRALVQRSSDIIAVFERDGSIRYVSPSVQRLLGYDPEEFLGETLANYVHPEDVERIMTAFVEGFNGAGSTGAPVEARCRHADGSWRYLEVIGTDLTSNPSIKGMVVNARDVTERKEYEEELKRSNAEIEQFAYVALHDLQEPLRMVSSYTQLLARRYKDQLDENAEEFIDYAVDGAERMQTLINDLLKYSRLESRSREFGPADCAAAYRAARANLKVAIEEKGADVSAVDLPIVHGDEVQLAQLFQNLIGNALKYSDPEKTPEVRVEAESTDDEWVFSVADNGIGIEQQYLDRIFEVFKRLHGREAYSGTGIGLAICKRIVERHGGRMWVESEPGVGSKFYFALTQSDDVVTEGSNGE